MEELPSKIKLARCGGHSASASNISSNSEELTKNALMMDKLQNAVQEQVARFRPPFTPSNSLLPASPPIIRVTPAIPQIFEYSSREANQPKINSPKVEEEEKVEELQQQEDDTSTNLNNNEKETEQQQQTQSTTSTQTEMPRPRPQPFPFIASRRRASTASHNALPSSYSFNFGSNLPGNRHSLPRLSITSLGSVAKTFSGLAAFIVPEEQSDKERFRELRIASQRRASLAISRGKNGGTPTPINDNSSKDSSRNSIKHNEDDEDKTSSECSDRSRMPNLYRER